MDKEMRNTIEYSYLINKGILLANNTYKKGKGAKITYDFDCKEYETLRKSLKKVKTTTGTAIYSTDALL